jgi:hypothetical protein
MGHSEERGPPDADLRAERDQLLEAQSGLERSRDEYAAYFELAPLPMLVLTRTGMLTSLTGTCEP